jgi:plasmid stability protein
MKNITVAVDDEVYRAARIAAAERSTSVSALVREYLQTLAAPADVQARAAANLFQAMDRASGLRAADRLSRDAAHER